MAKQTRPYAKFSRDDFNRLRQTLLAQGVRDLPAGDSGSFSAKGYTVSYAYDESLQTLNVTLEGGGLLMGLAWSTVEKGIRGA